MNIKKLMKREQETIDLAISALLYDVKALIGEETDRIAKKFKVSDENWLQLENAIGRELAKCLKADYYSVEW